MYLRAINGDFVIAENGGGEGAVHEPRDHAGPYETFLLHDLDGPVLLSGHQVTFRTKDKGLYLQAEGGGGPDARLLADGGAEEGPETFIIEKTDGRTGVIREGDEVTLRIGEPRRFVVAELNNGSTAMNVNRLSVGTWERFTIHVVPQ